MKDDEDMEKGEEISIEIKWNKTNNEWIEVKRSNKKTDIIKMDRQN